jgi:hypothetical protein
MKKVILYLLVLAFFVSCKKEDATPSKTDILVRTWQLDELSIAVGPVSQIGYKKGVMTTTPANDAALAAARAVFRADGTVTNDITTSAVITNGRWRLLNNDTQLEVTNGTTTYIYTILTLSATNLNYTENFAFQGTSTVITYKLIPL